MTDIDFALLDVPRDGTSRRRRRLPADGDGVALRRRHRVTLLATCRQGPGLRSADRRAVASTTCGCFPTSSTNCEACQSKTSSPAATASPLPVPRIFESGGTTGAPKRTAQLPDWVEQVTRWQVEDFTAGGFVRAAGCSA